MLGFFKRILPFFEKRKLMSQIDGIRQRRNDILTPALASIVEIYSAKATSEIGKRFERFMEKELKKIEPAINKGNFAYMVQLVNNDLGPKLDLSETYMKEMFQETTSSDALTFKQLEIIRVLDLFAFFLNYSMKTMNYLVWGELTKQGTKTDCPITDAEIKWLQQNESTYFGICKVICLKDADFKKAIESTTELTVSESDEANTVNVATDPLRLGFCPGVGSVILFVREQWLAYEVKKYEANKLRLQSIQLQLKLLQETQQENPEDESVKRQIDYITERVKKLEHDNHKFEEKAGVA